MTIVRADLLDFDFLHGKKRMNFGKETMPINAWKLETYWFCICNQYFFFNSNFSIAVQHVKMCVVVLCNPADNLQFYLRSALQMQT